MIDLNSLFATMQKRFNPQAALNMQAVFQYHISHDQSFSCVIDHGQCHFNEGINTNADVTLTLNTILLQGIISGEEDALQAFMEGSILAQGDLSLAPALVGLFPPANRV